ncbi:MAG: M14 family zinc carboxypeptidase, partial [Anaerolineae bacterium]
AGYDANYPDLVEMVDYGDSFCKGEGGCTTLGGDELEGFDLYAMRISNENVPGTSTINGDGTVTPGDKPVAVLMFNIHAREITTPELGIRVIREFVNGYGVDADLTWIADYHEVWVIPTSNPDGLWLVELGTKSPYGGSPLSYWKNANDAGCSSWPPSSFSQPGVDLNRNHTFKWNTGGSSGSPCNLTYRGTAAGSEPEVDQFETLVASLIPDQRGPGDTAPAPQDTTGLLISTHSFSELVLWPWGYTPGPAPNKTGLQAIGDKLATYNGYLSCQPSLCLYGTSGTTDDWSYGELGIPSFTFEVGTQFMPPYSEVDAIQWPDNGPAYIYTTRIARAPYMEVQGPDALDLNTTGGPAIVNLTALLDDNDNGGQDIAAAEYYINTPPWEPGAVANPMTPIFGGFNDPAVGVEAAVDLTGLPQGQHTIFVRGQDAGGNWGPVSAIFVETEGPFAAQPASTDLHTCVEGSTSTDITVTPLGGFTGQVSFSLLGSPAGTTGSFAPPNLTPPGATSLTIDASGVAAPGTTPVTVEVSSTSPASVDLIEMDLTVYDSGPTAPALLVPADGASNIYPIDLTLEWQAVADATSYDVGIFTDPGNPTGSLVAVGQNLTGTTFQSPVDLDENATYYWAVRANNPCGQQVTSFASFSTGSSLRILVVDDDDNNPDVRSDYTDMLAGMNYDVWSTNASDNEPDAGELAPYPVVLWFSGDAAGFFAGPGAFGEPALTTYISNGGCLALSSAGYYGGGALPSFAATTLGLSSITKDTGQSTVTGGLLPAGLFAGTYSLNSPYDNISDSLSLKSGTRAVFDGDQGTAASVRYTGDSLAFFFGFPLESLAAPDRQAVINDFITACSFLD